MAPKHGNPRVGPWFEVGDLKKAYDRWTKDQITDRAAGMTYYLLLSLFPALLFGIAVLGFFGQGGLITDAANYLRDAGAPPEAVDTVTTGLESAQKNRGTAATALLVGLATALYGASGAFAAAGRALNVVWRVQEGRSFIRQKVEQVIWTAIVLALVLVTLVLIFLGGGLAGDVLGALGLGETAASVWRIARWPAALVSAMLIYAVIYFAAPNVKVRAFEFITPGAILGVIITLVASGALFLYVSNFSNYGATYGTFAGLVILLIWMWVSNLVFLFGAELNAVVNLRRAPELPPTYDGPPLPEKVPAEA